MPGARRANVPSQSVWLTPSYFQDKLYAAATSDETTERLKNVWLGRMVMPDSHEFSLDGLPYDLEAKGMQWVHSLLGSAVLFLQKPEVWERSPFAKNLEVIRPPPSRPDPTFGSLPNP